MLSSYVLVVCEKVSDVGPVVLREPRGTNMEPMGKQGTDV